MLSKLEKYGISINDRKQSFFLTYDQLIFDTDKTLSSLTQFLKLESELKREYNVIRTTGWGSFGDWSETIQQLVCKESPAVEYKQNRNGAKNSYEEKNV